MVYRLIIAALLLLNFSLATAQDNVTFVNPSSDVTLQEGANLDISITIAIADGIDRFGLVVNGSTQTNTATNSGVVERNGETTESHVFLAAEYDILSNMQIGTYNVEIQAKEQGSATVITNSIVVTVEAAIGGGGSDNAIVDRNYNPLTLNGAQLTCLNSVNASDIVAYSFQSGNWLQIPMDVREKLVQDVGTPYNNESCHIGELSIDWDVEQYADANTFTGADADVTFDANDELVVMYKDLGDVGNGNYTGLSVNPSSVCKVQVTDPLNNTIKYVYFFEQTGGLNTSADSSYVDYTFSFDPDDTAGTFDENGYKTAYDICNFDTGDDNPETSTITTEQYTVGFSSRAVEDELRIETGAGLGVDILDRYEFTTDLVQDIRNTQKYTEARGNHVNILNGSVEAVRSTMGANSGIYTQSTGQYSKWRVYRKADFRVHGQGNAQLFSFLDYNANMVGAEFISSRINNFVTIDGTDDAVDTNEPADWDFVRSTHGNIVSIYDAVTNVAVGNFFEYQNGTVDLTFDGFYEDDANGFNVTGTTTGTRGAHGISFRADDVCFDRRYQSGACVGLAQPYPEMELIRIDYFLPPSSTRDDAIKLREFYDNPLQVEVVSALNDSGSGNGINILAPLDGASFQEGTSLEVVVEAFDSDNIEQLEILVAFNGGTAVSNEVIDITPAAGNVNLTFYPTVTANSDNDLSNMQQGSYVITVRATNTLSNAITDVANVTITPVAVVDGTYRVPEASRLLTQNTPLAPAAEGEYELTLMEDKETIDWQLKPVTIAPINYSFSNGLNRNGLNQVGLGGALNANSTIALGDNSFQFSGQDGSFNILNRGFRGNSIDNARTDNFYHRVQSLNNTAQLLSYKLGATNNEAYEVSTRADRVFIQARNNDNSSSRGMNIYFDRFQLSDFPSIINQTVSVGDHLMIETVNSDLSTVDIEISPLYLLSPDGTKWYLKVDNTGNITTSTTP